MTQTRDPELDPATRVALVAITRHGARLAGILAARLAMRGTGVRLVVTQKFADVAAEALARTQDAPAAWSRAATETTTTVDFRDRDASLEDLSDGVDAKDDDKDDKDDKGRLKTEPRLIGYQGPLSEQIGPLFASQDQLVFFVSLGAVLRLVAPHLKSKYEDPGVLVVDEAGRFVIPVLSGHLGGANAFAQSLATVLGATPVITTASDVRQTLAVDLLGRELGWRLDAPKLNLTRISASVVNGDPIALIQETGDRDWWRRDSPLPANIHLFDRFEDLDPTAYQGLLWVTEREIPAKLRRELGERLAIYRPGPPPAKPASVDPAEAEPAWVELAATNPAPAKPVAVEPAAKEPTGMEAAPAESTAAEPLATQTIGPPPVGSGDRPQAGDRERALVLGLGCDRGTSLATLTEAISLALGHLDRDGGDVRALATIDRKGDEPALLALAAERGWPLRLFTASELSQVPVPNPSATVLAHIGTPAVAEAAALLLAQELAGSRSRSEAATELDAGHPSADLVLEKCKFRGPDGKNVTVSLARPRSDQPGKLLLVGLGPGAPEQMTLRARAAIAEAEVVIGYGTYLKLIQDLIHGKEVIRKGMTEELDRCLAALAEARRGRRVALVSSGDIGVYGMAGPTFEVLLQAGWRPGEGLEVEVIPGITALSSSAALVGAPLTHDFCAISLSDLLTPWPVIARRLAAAAHGDFVIALYNPKSGKRSAQILAAQRILLRHRPPETPVAVVTAAYRDAQAVLLGRLAELADYPLGMLSTVLIGNSQTTLREGLMVTPRGYANKYDPQSGEARSGEKAGRSLSQGLEGWRAAIRAHRGRYPEEPLADLARRFDVEVEDILDALGDEVAQILKKGVGDEEPAPYGKPRQ